jgi:hypothetical protein
MYFKIYLFLNSGIILNLSVLSNPIEPSEQLDKINKDSNLNIQKESNNKGMFNL